MKHLIKVVFPLLLLYSCSKSVENFDLKKESSYSLVGEKLLLKLSSFASVQDQKQAYSTLSDEERYTVWRTKLSNSIDFFKNEQKKAHAVSEFKDNLTLSFFKEGDKREVFTKIYIPNWISKNSEIFSRDEIYSLLFTLENSNSKTNLSLTTMGDESSGKNCHCKVGSDWTCYQGLGLFANCYNLNNCIQATRGCGALLDDKCNGDFCTVL